MKILTSNQLPSDKKIPAADYQLNPLPVLQEPFTSTSASTSASPYPEETHKPSKVSVDERHDYLQEAQQELNENQTSDNSSSFGVSNEQLQLLHSDKNIYLIKALGGLQGLESKLNTNVQKGLPYKGESPSSPSSLPEPNLNHSSSSQQRPHQTYANYNAHPNNDTTTATEANETMNHTLSTAISNSNIHASPYQPPISTTNNTPDKQRKQSSFSGPGSSLQPYSSSASDSTKNSNDNPSFEKRQDFYGVNKLPEKKPKTFLALVWMALQDKVLILLSIVAVVSLAIGLYETFGQPPKYEDGKQEPKVEWVEGVAIIVAIAIVSLVGAGNDWQKERQFVKLNKKKDNRLVRVIRSGHIIEISIFDIVVGDLVQLEPGDVVPCDGVLVNSYGIRCDESSLTGESDTIKKATVSQALEKLEAKPNCPPNQKGLDCFIASGSRVLEGTGDFLATAVGTNSFYGKTLMSLQTEAEETPLQAKLNIIAEGIAKIGTLAAGIMFLVLFIRFLAQLPGNTQTSAGKAEEFMNIIITAITIIVVAVPEGLPLAVTLALAFATTRMIKDNNLVRVLKACETMGGATTVCSDKTGTLTQNKMTVVAGILGLNQEFELQIDASHEQEQDLDNTKKHETHGVSKLFHHNNTKDDSTVNNMPIDHAPVANSSSSLPSPQQFVSNLTPQAYDVLLSSIIVNTSAFENIEYESEMSQGNTAVEHYIGSKTETAILSFAYEFLNMGNLEAARNNYSVARVYPFDSANKYMATVIELPNKSGFRLLVKGASEVMISVCTSILDGENVRPIKEKETEQIKDQIIQYASNSLRAIGLVYRDFEGLESWPPYELKDDKNLLQEMTFLGVVGIKDPLRHGVTKAVSDCQRAGVVVRMVTGDNIVTAKAISIDCGILDPDSDHVVMEGPVFRKKTRQELYELVPKLRVLARSSPDDKRMLVQTLKEMGETVAVTGDGTNDAPALKLADVGFSMGISGTEVAKEASDIILMDDNFGSIVKAIIWGRTVNDAVKKFLQFQLTVNITAVVLTFVSSIASSSNTSVLTAVQLLWVNLIMDTFAALALATDPPNPSVLDRKPDNRKASLITPTMWKIIIGEAAYQLIVSFVLNFAGSGIFYNGTLSSHQEVQIKALVFNTFVWMQYFKMFVARRLDNKYNMFEGIWKNWYYVAISSIILGAQILIMFVGGAAFSIQRQTGAQWGTAIICGFGSIPVGLLLRTIPDEWVIRMFPTRLYRALGRYGSKLLFWRYWTRRDDDQSPTIRINDDEESRIDSLPHYIWPAPLEQVKQDLLILKLRGGRWNQIKAKPKQVYMRVKKSFNSSSSSLDIDSNASGTTLNSPVDSIGYNSSFIQPQANGIVSQDNAGFLTVPGGNAHGSQRHHMFGRSRGSSTSSGYSIEALTMVPTIIGGAIAGWGGEVDATHSSVSSSPQRESVNNQQHTSNSRSGSSNSPRSGNNESEEAGDSMSGLLLVTPPPSSGTDEVYYHNIG